MNGNVNRAFMYGESAFTTMRMVKGTLQDWDSHFDRLKKSAEFLYGPFTESADWQFLLKSELETRMEDIKGDQIIRLTIYRSQARGLVRKGIISVSDLKVDVNATEFDPRRIEDDKLSLRTCLRPKRAHWWPSYLKAGNYLDTILCQRMYLKPEDDDLLFVTEHDTVLESSVANIFVVRHDKIYTAPLGPNVLDGVIRKKVIARGGEFFEDVIESETTLEQLFRADAVFGSNSVRGLFLVDRIDDYEIHYNSSFLEKYKMLSTAIWS